VISNKLQNFVRQVKRGIIPNTPGKIINALETKDNEHDYNCFYISPRCTKRCIYFLLNIWLFLLISKR